MNVIGIDPGLSGAIALISDDNQVHYFWDMPTITVLKQSSRSKKDDMFDIPRTIQLIKELAESWTPIQAYLEWNTAWGGEGVLSAVKIGEGRMLIGCLCQSVGIPWHKIAPQSWTKALKVSGKKEATAIAQRYELACRLYPSIASELVTPRGRKLDGRIDALLIAHYYKNKTNGEA